MDEVDNKKLPIKVQGLVYYTEEDSHEIKVLCLKRSMEDGGFWHIVTGTVEGLEESLSACLYRELEEEIGIKKEEVLRIDPELHRFLWEKKGLPIWVFTYGVEINTKEVMLNEEHTDYKWLSIEDARALFESDSAKAAIEAFSSMK